MVVLTSVTQKNGEPVYFDESIPQVHFMKLISCSLANSWHNLTSVGQISFMSGSVLASIPQGHYTVDSLAKELTSSLADYKNDAKINVDTHNPNSVLKIVRMNRHLCK